MNHIQEFLKAYQHANYIKTYLGKNPENDDYLEETVSLLFTLVSCQVQASKNLPTDVDREDVLDSLRYIGQSLEIANSCLYLFCFGHYPAPKYLLAKILNLFWFARLSLINPIISINIKSKLDLRIDFRTESQKSTKSYLNRFMVKDREVIKIVTQNNTKTNLPKNLTDGIKQVVYNAYPIQKDFKKANAQTFQTLYSPTKIEQQFSKNSFQDFLFLYRCFLELIKVQLESTFIFLDPEKIFELFVLENLKLGHKTLQIYQDLETKFNKQNFQKLNFKAIPYFDFTEI